MHTYWTTQASKQNMPQAIKDNKLFVLLLIGPCIAMTKHNWNGKKAGIE